jgi:hypothetical protein
MSSVLRRNTMHQDDAPNWAYAMRSLGAGRLPGAKATAVGPQLQRKSPKLLCTIDAARPYFSIR